MPLSFNILRGMEGDRDCKVLEIRHQFPEEVPEEPEVVEEIAQVDPALMARQIIREAEEKARQITVDAREAAGQLEEGIVRDALEEAERIKEQARQEAYDQGIREAMSETAADAAQMREQARSVLREAEEIRRQTIDSVESEIVRLSIEIAEKVLSAKLRLHPQVVVDIAREAIGMLHERERVVLFANPAEADVFEERRDDLVKLLPPRGELYIIADEEVAPGGCIAETEHGRVDAGLDTRWEALLKALEDMLR